MSITTTLRQPPTDLTNAIPEKIATKVMQTKQQTRQPSQSEVTPEAEEVTPPQEEMLSPKFAALARKEKAIRSKYEELKTKEEALKAREAQMDSSYVSRDKIAELLANDPESLGVKWDDLAQRILEQPKTDDPTYRSLKAQIQKLEEGQTKALTQIEEQRNRAYDQAVNSIRNEAKLLIDSDSAYETIKEEGAAEAVVELIKQMFDQTQEIMSVEEAAKQVEEHLVEESLRRAKYKKVKERLLSQAAEKPATETPQKQQPEAPGLKTLTNAVSASSKPLSNKERRERAIAAFMGQQN